jgi:hypothetical protein
MNESFTPSSQHPIIPSSSSPQHLPVPTPRRAEIVMSLGTMADVPFMDALQKRHGRALGYFPTKQFEGYIASGGVLIGRDAASGVRLGYCISRDRYLKRDELGVIYQLCVEQGEQRKLVGAALVREVFARAAYGCRLFCCWCAQDLAANYFWESMGFIPIAFRAGGRKGRGARGKGRAKENGQSASSLAPDPSPLTPSPRVHIFWQRRVDGDRGSEVGGRGSESVSSNDSPPTTHDPRRATPYWYPCATNGGAIREDRLVFPIPPGVHWKDVEAVAVPDRGSGIGCRASGEEEKQKRLASATRSPNPEPRNPTQTISAGGLFFGAARPAAKAKVQRAPKQKVKVAPALVAKARELRDRYLEQVNARLLLAPGGKYDVSRALPPPTAPAGPRRARLAAAA